MGKTFDLITIGRAAIDLNAADYNKPMEETKTFNKYVGGSPVNIAIGTAKLGLKVGFIGKISDDQHGRFIHSYLEETHVDTTGVILDKEGHKSGLTFTEIKSPTECSILMYRDQVADLYLQPSEIDADYIKSTQYLLISGTGLSQSPSREAVLKALAIAIENQVKVIFEIDYRPYTWKNTEETALYYQLVAKQADIIIGTRDEFDILENKTGGDNEVTVRFLFQYRPELIVIKHGVKGSYAYKKDGSVTRVHAYKANVVKTFGAGDSYASGFIRGLIKNENIETCLKYGSAAAAIVVSSLSSSEAMPTFEEIERIINKQN